jgi:hypothetical protein
LSSTAVEHRHARQAERLRLALRPGRLRAPADQSSSTTSAIDLARAARAIHRSIRRRSRSAAILRRAAASSAIPRAAITAGSASIWPSDPALGSAVAPERLDHRIALGMQGTRDRIRGPGDLDQAGDR